jgi:hypothetical protein
MDVNGLITCVWEFGKTIYGGSWGGGGGWVDRFTVRAEGGSGINFLGEENWKGTTVPTTVRRYKQENDAPTQKSPRNTGKLSAPTQFKKCHFSLMWRMGI